MTNLPTLRELYDLGYDAITVGYTDNERDIFHKAVEQMAGTDYKLGICKRGLRYICRPHQQIKLGVEA